MVGRTDMTKFRNGDRVVVPWGLDQREGVVVDSFGPAEDPFVTVRLIWEFPESDEPSIPDDIGFKASALRHVDNEAVA